MKLAATLLVAAALALAGCLSGDPEVEAAATDGCGSASASASGATASADCEGATASAGDAQASATSNEAQATATATAAATRTTVPFSAEGNTYNGVFACAVVVCQGSDLPTTGSGDAWFTPEIDGTLDAAELTLTWSAATPATAELLLGIAYEDEDGEFAWVYAEGPSPLTLSETGLGIPASKIEAIYVNGYKCNGAAVVIQCTGFEQAFTIEGTLTTTA